MKQGVMKKVFKVIAFVFIGMFLYGVVTFTLMTIKYGLHFGYVSNGDIELMGGFLVTAVILGAMLFGNSDGKSVVSGYSYGDDKFSPIIGNDPLDPSSIDLFADCNDFD